MRRLSATVLVLVALDVVAGRCMRSGWIAVRALPPFDALTNSVQRAWLAAQTSSSETALAGSTVRFDAQLGWCNARATRSADGNCSYGSAGARGPREYAADAGAARVRCAAFGDSFTHGDGLRDEETWEHLLEARRTDVDVANFGVGGYGVDQALLRFRRDGRALAPHVVWIGLMLEDVGRHVNRYRPLYHPNSPTCAAKPRFALDGAELRLVPLPYATREELVRAIADDRVLDELRDDEGWANRWPSWTRHSATLSLVAGLQFYRSVDAQRLWTRPSEARELGVALLRAFHREALASGARGAGVIVYPRRAELELVLARRTRWWRALLEELERAHIPVLDLSDSLAERTSARSDASDAMDSAASSSTDASDAAREWYQPDGHPNARANARFASAVEQWAITQGWLAPR